MFAVTGGSWGQEGLERLQEDRTVSSMSKRDFLIVLGDCGVFVPRVELSESAASYRSLPCSVLFLDGSRDDYDAVADQPAFPWNGGLVHTVSRGVTHLLRGQVFRLGGLSLLTVGGATTPGRTDAGKYWDWWPGQDVSAEDAETALRNIGKAGGGVDLVLSCECPSSWKSSVGEGVATVSSDVLETISRKVPYGHWYFGNGYDETELQEVRASAVGGRVIPIA